MWHVNDGCFRFADKWSELSSEFVCKFSAVKHFFCSILGGAALLVYFQLHLRIFIMPKWCEYSKTQFSQTEFAQLNKCLLLPMWTFELLCKYCHHQSRLANVIKFPSIFNIEKFPAKWIVTELLLYILYIKPFENEKKKN